MFPVDKLTGDSNASKQDDKKIDTSDERRALDTFDKDEKSDSKSDSDSDGDKSDEDESERTTDKEDEDDKGEKEDGEGTEDDEGEQEEDGEEEQALSDDSIYQKLKKEHPKLLKEMPELRSTIFREQKYTELLPTIKDAEQAVEAMDILSGLQQEIVSGSSEKFIKSVNELGDGVLEGFLGNFTNALYEISKDTYLNFMYPEFKKVLRAAARNSDERISAAAHNLHHFIFGDADFNAEVGLSTKKKDPREDKVAVREQEFENKQLNSARQDVGQSCEKRLKFNIMKPLQDAGISKLQAKFLEDEIFRRVDSATAKDVRHMGNIRHLWDRARKEGYTSEGKDRIINAYLSRAKLLVPKYRQQVLSEAKVSAKMKFDEKDKKETKRIPSSDGSKSRSVGTEKVDPKKVDWTKTSERDLLDGKFTAKT